MMKATTQVVVDADSEGYWTFCVSSDDGFQLRINDTSDSSIVAGSNSLAGDAATAIDENGYLEFADGRGGSDSFGTIYLAEGTYDLDLRWFEWGGGECVELSYAVGEQLGWNDALFQLLGNAQPLPDNMFEVFYAAGNHDGFDGAFDLLGDNLTFEGPVRLLRRWRHATGRRPQRRRRRQQRRPGSRPGKLGRDSLSEHQWRRQRGRVRRQRRPGRRSRQLGSNRRRGRARADRLGPASQPGRSRPASHATVTTNKCLPSPRHIEGARANIKNSLERPGPATGRSRRFAPYRLEDRPCRQSSCDAGGTSRPGSKDARESSALLPQKH